MPQNILITAMAMFLGWQVARVLLFCAALPDRVELHCELDGTVTCEGVHVGADAPEGHAEPHPRADGCLKEDGTCDPVKSLGWSRFAGRPCDTTGNSS